MWCTSCRWVWPWSKCNLLQVFDKCIHWRSRLLRLIFSPPQIKDSHVKKIVDVYKKQQLWFHTNIENENPGQRVETTEFHVSVSWAHELSILLCYTSTWSTETIENHGPKAHGWHFLNLLNLLVLAAVLWNSPAENRWCVKLLCHSGKLSHVLNSQPYITLLCCSGKEELLYYSELNSRESIGYYSWDPFFY